MSNAQPAPLTPAEMLAARPWAKSEAKTAKTTKTAKPVEEPPAALTAEQEAVLALYNERKAERDAAAAAFAEAEELLRDVLPVPTVGNPVALASAAGISIKLSQGKPAQGFDKKTFGEKYPQLLKEFTKTGELPKARLTVTVPKVESEE